MQVFVTGATGFIGLAVASAFARRGHRVLGLARTSEKARELMRREIEPVIGTLQEPGAWRNRAAACSTYVHCAFEYSAKGFELDRNVLRTLSELGGRKGEARTLLYTSGVWVYGDTGTRCVDESTAPNPPKFVAARVENENFVLSCARPELATIVLRPGCVYGGHGSLTAAWFDGATKGAARFVGDGAQRWAMVHVDDLAELYVLAAEARRACDVFNATDRSRNTIRDCAEAASRVAGGNGRIESIPVDEAIKTYGPMAEALAFTQHADSSKAARLLGWQPRHAGFVDEVERLYLAWRAQRAS
ncbi:MAG: NAD-dependent epimerase/dehydratase family protein [Planctomycetes bacterium]|nr:NAD-dependent epimerase/dehydratase family protein [Planctomycetota bacterium]